MSDLSPAVTGHGVSPYPLNDTADVEPKAPCQSDGFVGTSPYPIGGGDEVEPKADRHDGHMNIPSGPKPGSFK